MDVIILIQRSRFEAVRQFLFNDSLETFTSKKSSEVSELAVGWRHLPEYSTEQKQSQFNILIYSYLAFSLRYSGLFIQITAY